MKHKYLLLCSILALCLFGCKSSPQSSKIPEKEIFPVEEETTDVDVVDVIEEDIETIELSDESGEYTVVSVEKAETYDSDNEMEKSEEYDVSVETIADDSDEYIAEEIKTDDATEINIEEYSVFENTESTESDSTEENTEIVEIITESSEDQEDKKEEISVFDDNYVYEDDFQYNDDYLSEYAENADATEAVTSETETKTEIAQSIQKSEDDNKTVSAQSFMIDYSDEKYKDYSGYNYGDEEYNECVAKFGPASFPSDKIIAEGRKSAKQLYNFFVSKNPNGDLERAKRLAELYVEECKIEGVNSDLAFVQMCHETGFLRFGNLVTPDMNNFCGLGSLSKSNPGVRFETERQGVRAHVQHLQAYGSKNKLKQTLIDPRYKYVTPRGKSPTLAGLTGTWAVDPNYDKKIYSFMKELAHF